MMMSEQNHELSDFSLSVREKENTNYHQSNFNDKDSLVP